MSNALRLFIRESLTNEAVGQVTFIKQDPTLTKVKAGSSSTDKGMAALGRAGTTVLSKMKGAAKRAAKSSKGQVARGAVGISLLSIVVGELASLWGGSNGNTEANGEAATVFEDEITKIISDSSDAIIEKLRTPAIKSGFATEANAAAQTAAITAYETNYENHADFIIVAANSGEYANFFTKMPAFKACKSGLDAAITGEINGSNDINVKKDLESFVLNYLIYHAICFTNTDSASASGLDVQALEAAGFIEDNSDNQAANDNLAKIKDCNLKQANKINYNAACVAVIDQFAE